jgi:hypothetical protein
MAKFNGGDGIGENYWYKERNQGQWRKVESDKLNNQNDLFLVSDNPKPAKY